MHTLFKRYPALAKTFQETRATRMEDAGIAAKMEEAKGIPFSYKVLAALKDIFVPW